jgi:hypothetical protein
MAGIPADSGWQALRRGKRPGLGQKRVLCPTPRRYPPYVFTEDTMEVTHENLKTIVKGSGGYH